MSRFLIVSATLLLTATSASISFAQSKRFDVKDYLNRLDRNKNGLIEPDEMKGRTEGFLKGMGFDTGKPVKLQDVVRKVDNDREKQKSASSSRQNLKVPGFGVEREVVGVPDFSATVEADGKGAISFEDRYGKEIAERVDQVLKRYDLNRNGRLDPDEIEKGRWGSPSPSSSDTNRDGYLTRSELARRYIAREGSSSSWSNRGDRGDRDRERDRGRSESRSERSSRSSSRERSSSRDSSSRRSSSSSSPSSSRSSSSKSSSSSNASSASRYQKYAESLIKKYDANQDGKLDKAERTKMTAAPKESADANKDGYITAQELADSLSGKTSSSSGARSSDSSESRDRKRSPSERGSSYRDRSSSSRRSSTPSSFSEGDGDRDGQIQMHEFAKEWSKEEVSGFEKRDLNGDGVITAEEWSKSRSSGK